MTRDGDDIGFGESPGGDDLLAAEYVLGLLPPEIAAEVEARLITDPDLRDLVEGWQGRMADLAGTVPPEVPPAILRGQIETRLFGAPVPIWQRLRQRLGLWPLLTATALAAVLILGLIRLDLLGVDTPSAQMPFAAALTATEAVPEAGATAVAFVTLDPDRGLLTADLPGLSPVPGHSHELWLIAGEDAPVSLGLVPPGAPVTLSLPDALRTAVATGAILAISAEPEGGSPTGLPTGPVLAAGAITAL